MVLPNIRTRIVSEFTRRIKAQIPYMLYQGEAQIWGKWTRELPCMHLYELVTDKILIRPGVYQVVLPLQIEFVQKLPERFTLFTEGKKMLQNLQSAIELDERFQEGFSTDTLGDELVISYFMSSDEIVEVTPGTVIATQLYQFTYADKFLGYQSFRH